MEVCLTQRLGVVLDAHTDGGWPGYISMDTSLTANTIYTRPIVFRLGLPLLGRVRPIGVVWRELRTIFLKCFGEYAPATSLCRQELSGPRPLVQK